MVACDETIMRMFPPLRAAWSPVGEQAEVPISGRNDKRVIYAALNLRTGHRIALVRRRTGTVEFCEFLRLRRRHYRHRPLVLLLDHAPWHIPKRVLALASELAIELMWLPKQSPELNPMDHLFREMKRIIAATRQIQPLDQHVTIAVDWMMALTPTQTRTKAALRSPSFWLFPLSKNF